MIKGLWAIVKGASDGVKPDDVSKDHPCLTLNVELQHMGAVRRAKSTQQACCKLKDTCQAKGKAKRIQLKRELTALGP